MAGELQFGAHSHGGQQKRFNGNSKVVMNDFDMGLASWETCSGPTSVAFCSFKVAATNEQDRYDRATTMPTMRKSRTNSASIASGLSAVLSSSASTDTSGKGRPHRPFTSHHNQDYG